MFEEKGEDRNLHESTGTMPGNTPRLVWYDAGATAIAFAAHKANKSVVTFYTDYFQHIKPINRTTANPKGSNGDISYTEGWKKAFLEWSGFSSTADFYAQFKDFMTSQTSWEGAKSLLETAD